MRKDGRTPDSLRPVAMEAEYTDTRGGSVLIRWGGTRVLCTALLEPGTAPFLKDSGKGWLTAEYGMLPSSTGGRKRRGTDSRATEIQRLIGRSLREAVDLTRIGDNTVYLDCDVLQADGGTRTASITGAYVALRIGAEKWIAEGRLQENPVVHQVAAVSVGIVDDIPMLDLCYEEDSRAMTDMNIVMNEAGNLIEIQGTGEGRAFSRSELSALLDLGGKGIRELMELQDLAWKRNV